MTETSIRSEVAQITLIENGYFHIVYDANTILTLEKAKAVVEAQKKLAVNNQYPNLLEGRSLKEVTPDARKFLASQETAEVNSAVALLVGSPVSRILGNFFLKLDRPAYPMRLFSNQEEAFEWLRQFFHK